MNGEIILALPVPLAPFHEQAGVLSALDAALQALVIV